VIGLTDAAISQASKKATAEGKQFIRVGLVPGGCTGFEYIFEWADEINNDDHIEAYGNFKIVVDAYSKPYLTEATLDFVKEGLNEQFKIMNPAEKASCGCGISVQF